ncbi:MAG TPA: metallophosphoesterase [Thermoanaerobaculia bacterium]|jgi:predicted MPP superfamily phosphohydrolase|nr:metallophosphoesterase [Thermoanaerobaculia bacterium]
MNRRRFLRLSATAAAAACGVGVYTWQIEPHWVEVVERDLPVAGLPPELAGARMVQISDLHVGPRVSDEYLIDCLRRVAEIQPDILVITGDLLTYSHPAGEAQYGQLRRVLSHLPHGRLGTVGILGNHDYGRAWSEPGVALRVMAEAEGAGIRMLRNSCATVKGLDFIGVDDLWAKHSDTRRALEQRRSEAAIALCHNPDAMDSLDWDGYRGWILAGHTHGGQCKPPFLPPPMLPVKNPRYTAGEIPLADGRRLYINRGLGHLLQVRFNVRPEITSFTLRAS